MHTWDMGSGILDELALKVGVYSACENVSYGSVASNCLHKAMGLRKGCSILEFV